jgi:hypothetical protein
LASRSKAGNKIDPGDGIDNSKGQIDLSQIYIVFGAVSFGSRAEVYGQAKRPVDNGVAVTNELSKRPLQKWKHRTGRSPILRIGNSRSYQIACETGRIRRTGMIGKAIVLNR